MYYIQLINHESDEVTDTIGPFRSLEFATMAERDANKAINHHRLYTKLVFKK